MKVVYVFLDLRGAGVTVISDYSICAFSSVDRSVCVCGTQAGGGSTCWMNAVSIGEYHGLRVGSALLSIVAGCIIIGVSKDCDADAVGGIFLGAGGLGKFSRFHNLEPIRMTASYVHKPTGNLV